MAKLADVFAENVVWHTPGRNSVSGDYTSRDAAFEPFAKELELSAGTYSPEIHDILANDEHTVALLHVTAARNGKTLGENYLLIFHIQDGKITEAWEAWTDEAAWNEFWSWAEWTEVEFIQAGGGPPVSSVPQRSRAPKR
jgi:ketosteroid isomerase-like protein